MHPRFKHFPWQSDYSAQPNQFCPYIMATAQPGYSSSAVNIDEHGFRVQYDRMGRRLYLSRLREKYEGCILILGNSASFGVSVSSDNKTLGHFLGDEKFPCINLSIRGATMQQELSVFMAFKHLLPKIHKIIVVTGVCDVSLAVQPEDIYSASVGGMHSMETYFRKHYQRTLNDAGVAGIAKENYLAKAEEIYHRYRWIQKYFESTSRSFSMQRIVDSSEFDKNFSFILKLIENVIESWGWIQKGGEVEVNIVLQPVIGWTSKARSTIEDECIEQDLRSNPAIDLYANASVHKRVITTVEKSCLMHGLKYIDANLTFDRYSSSQTCFTDICHLTDYGTELLALVINRELM